MKKVLISIYPERVAKILNGSKTIEVRKNVPKCGLPCEVYIYCSNYSREVLKRDLKDIDSVKHLEGKIVAKFTFNKVETYKWEKGYHYDKNKTQLDGWQMCNYGSSSNYEMRTLYGWLIDNLEIFDEPKTLADFGLKRPPQSWQYIKEKTYE